MSDLQLTIVNPAIAAPPRNLLLIGVTAQLLLTLRNSGDSAGTLRSAGAQPSTLSVFLPPFCSRPKPRDVHVDGWTPAIVGDRILLTYAGPDGAAWPPGIAVDISLADIVGTGRPTTGRLQVNPANMGDVPPQATAALSLQNPPQPGNGNLKETLQLSLDHQGTVYVSEPSWDQPLSNTLFLTIENASPQSLYTGPADHRGSPQVIVSFVCGRTSGALAFDDDRSVPPPPGSIWSVQAALDADSTGWRTTNPDVRDPGVASPVWVLEPLPANTGLLGPASGDAANVTFALSGIVSMSQPGHTQLIVQLTGFRKDAATGYDDAVFVLDISKQEAPELYGVSNFHATVPIITPDLRLTAPLRWTMYNVARVELSYSVAGQNFTHEVVYPNPQPLAYDRLDVPIRGRIEGTVDVVFTLQAYDSNGAELNSSQFTVVVEGAVFVDPRDQKSYPAVLIGGKFWTMSNLDYAGAGLVYNNDRASELMYGRLYRWDEAQSPDSAWRLPTFDDWQALVGAVGYQQAYAALMPGGGSGFDGQLGGWTWQVSDEAPATPSAPARTSSQGIFVKAGEIGLYWTVSPAGDARHWAFFLIGESRLVTCQAFDQSEPDPTVRFAVRYVKDPT